MSQGIHRVSSSVAGYTLPDGKCRASGRAALLSFTNRGHKHFAGANALLRTFPSHSPKTALVLCKASNNHRRNSDFSRQHRGPSRGRNRQYQEHENSDNFEDIDPLPSKNGSLVSISSNQRHSTTATPGQREKEIVELFRKVQAQLRERAAIKEEKKTESAMQQGQGERGTVDSLLNLLRKHSVAQGKKSRGQDELSPERDSSFSSPEPSPVPSRRPASNCRRRSPVPQVKFQPVFSAEGGVHSTSALKSEEDEKVNVGEPESELVEHSDPSDTEQLKDEPLEASAPEITDLASLKLSELRDVAKSRGAKGYSKLKKAELVKFLSKEY